MIRLIRVLRFLILLFDSEPPVQATLWPNIGGDELCIRGWRRQGRVSARRMNEDMEYAFTRETALASAFE